MIVAQLVGLELQTKGIMMKNDNYGNKKENLAREAQDQWKVVQKLFSEIIEATHRGEYISRSKVIDALNSTIDLTDSLKGLCPPLNEEGVSGEAVKKEAAKDEEINDLQEYVDYWIERTFHNMKMDAFIFFNSGFERYENHNVTIDVGQRRYKASFVINSEVAKFMRNSVSNGESLMSKLKKSIRNDFDRLEIFFKNKI